MTENLKGEELDNNRSVLAQKLFCKWIMSTSLLYTELLILFSLYLVNLLWILFDQSKGTGILKSWGRYTCRKWIKPSQEPCQNQKFNKIWNPLFNSFLFVSSSLYLLNLYILFPSYNFFLFSGKSPS